MSSDRTVPDLVEQIIQAALEVHQHLGGPGLIESIYESALCHELLLRKIHYRRQVAVPVVYKGNSIRKPLFLDILVEGQIVVEVKASEPHLPYYLAQLNTHMRFLKIPQGLLINFGQGSLKEGIFQVMSGEKSPECL